MDWFQENGIVAGDQGGGDPQYSPEEGAYDPFAYTRGSLLTPWEGHFDAPSGGGGSGVAEFKPFQYGSFGYSAANPGSFDERYNDPGNFVYGDYKSLDNFKAPTAEDMQADPSYQFRLDQGRKALEASKAAQGILKTGGTAKGLMEYGQGYASQEYGNVYNRKIGEYDRNVNENRFSYGTNRNNNAENWDRNVANARAGHQIRQQDWMGNAQVALDASRHGYDVASGTYDRNLALARTQYQDSAQHAQALASAAASGSARDYNRALAEYQMSRDEFWTNQDRQYNVLDREASRGYNAALAYAGGAGDLYTGAANAQASGIVGGANARAGAATNIGGTLGGLALYGGQYGGGGYTGGGGGYYGGYGGGYGDEDNDGYEGGP